MRLFLLTILLTSPSLAMATNHQDKPKQDQCYVHLFDGSKFKDDNIVIYGPAKYKNLDHLPNAHGKNWTDEADSFKVGPKTKLSLWMKENFEGQSQAFKTGEYPSEDEPYSLKIECQ